MTVMSSLVCFPPCCLRQALQAVHDHGWLHGDLRSHNLMCDVVAKKVRCAMGA